MTTYKHGLANPEYFISTSEFYEKFASHGDVADVVAEKARKIGKPQYKLALDIVSSLTEKPNIRSLSDMRKYFVDNVLSKVSRRVYYDDVFWCCFLSSLNSSWGPEFSYGGPLHQVIVEVHDDFDPSDVVL